MALCLEDPDPSLSTAILSDVAILGISFFILWWTEVGKIHSMDLESDKLSNSCQFSHFRVTDTIFQGLCPSLQKHLAAMYATSLAFSTPGSPKDLFRY